MYWLQRVIMVNMLPLCAVVLLSGCAGMQTGIVSTATSAADRLLGVIFNKTFAPELKPVDPGYAAFYDDLASELQYNCKNGDCRSARFGWASKEVSANFEVECMPAKNRLMSCEHFKQTIGDMKVYPAGMSVYEFVNVRFELRAHELRGNGKTDAVSLALGKGEIYLPPPQENIQRTAAVETPVITVPVAQPTIPSHAFVNEKNNPIFPPATMILRPQTKPNAERHISDNLSEGKMMRADLRIPSAPKKKEPPKKTKKNRKIKNTKTHKEKSMMIKGLRVT